MYVLACVRTYVCQGAFQWHPPTTSWQQCIMSNATVDEPQHRSTTSLPPPAATTRTGGDDPNVVNRQPRRVHHVHDTLPVQARNGHTILRDNMGAGCGCVRTREQREVQNHPSMQNQREAIHESVMHVSHDLHKWGHVSGCKAPAPRHML
jgi:hypothetical protein